MDDHDVHRSVTEIASVSLGKDVATANFDTTDLLLHGSNLTGPSAVHGGASATVQYIEWHEDRVALNDFTVVDQLRVKNRAGDVSILDVVLFVNGIPLVAQTWPTPFAMPCSTCVTMRVTPSRTTSVTELICPSPAGYPSSSGPYSC